MVYTEYRITNLGELMQMAQAIMDEVNQDRGERVDASEVYITGPMMDFANFTVSSHKLTDGSVAYNIEVSA